MSAGYDWSAALILAAARSEVLRPSRCRRLSIQKTALPGNMHRLGTSGHLELLEYVADVPFHRSRPQLKAQRDLLVSQPARQHLEDLPLTPGQGGGEMDRECFGKPVRDLGGHEGAPGLHGVDRLGKQGGSGILQEESARARFQSR